MSGCAPTQTASTATSTPTILLSTSTPEPILTPEPTSTATPTPSILEKHEHVLAYSEKDQVFIVDENGKNITTIKSDIGWIQDFKVSPDNKSVIFTLLDKKNSDFGYYGYGLHFQTLGNKKNTPIVSQNIRVIFADWVNNEQIIATTLDETFLWSTDGTKEVIASHKGLFQSPQDSFIYSTTSPTQHDALILQRYVADDIEEEGCKIFHLDMSNGQIVKLAGGVKNGSCDYTWLPDSRYASITHNEVIDYFYVDITSTFDAETNSILYTQNNVDNPTWSPDGKYFSHFYWTYSRSKAFAFDIKTYDFQGNDETVFSYSGGTPISERLWSSDSQLLLYRENRTFNVVDISTLSTTKVIKYADVSPKYNPIVWWSPTSNHIFFTAITNDNGEVKNGIHYVSIESNSATLVAELPKFPDFVNSVVVTSPDNQYTVLYVNISGHAIFTVIDNETKTSTVQLQSDTGGPPSKVLWIK